jgi:hypothetical protein
MSWDYIHNSWVVIADLTADMVVSYNKEKIVQIEEGHGRHDLSGMYYTINFVKVYIGEEAIDITKMLTRSMEDEILERINRLENDL